MPVNEGVDEDPGQHPDAIEETDSSTRLFGATIEYQHSTANHYRLRFDRDFNVTFEFLHEVGVDDSPSAVHGPLVSYRAKEIRSDLLLVHWMVKDAVIHVSLSIDLECRQIHVSAMLPPNRFEFWDTAKIIDLDLKN